MLLLLIRFFSSSKLHYFICFRIVASINIFMVWFWSHLFVPKTGLETIFFLNMFLTYMPLSIFNFCKIIGLILNLNICNYYGF